MRRVILLVCPAVLALAAGALALWPRALPGQPGKAPVEQPPAAPTLPITKVVLFTSGVAYFQREAEIDGDATIDLTFPVGDIDDLLKSSVLRDFGGGTVQAVGYDSQDPVEKSLRSFAINLSGNPTLSQILNQARGEQVEILVPTFSQNKLSGSLVGIEKKQQTTKDGLVMEIEYLNLWSSEGLRSFKLADVQQIHFANAALQSEVNRALQVLSRAHDTQKKSVSLRFKGQGKRRVLVGYVAEHPVWRTSYRLVLSERDKPYLQGWAMLENPTSEDWSKVGLRLVSGRPVSFRMDLYQPLYVNRPLVELEQYANLRPRAYESTFTSVGTTIGSTVGGKGEPKPGDVPAPTAVRKPPLEREIAGEKAAGKAAMGKDDGVRDKDVDLRGSVAAQAEAGRVGEAFHYEVKDPLTLPRQKSALAPIVTADLSGERVSIYNAAQQKQYPLLGLKLKNTSGLYLMQGPISVFDGGAYAGDALIRDVRPGEERLLSYALDQGIEVKTEHAKEPEKLLEIRVNRGIVERTWRLRETWKYTFKSRADSDRMLVLEHPARTPDWKLVSPTEKPSATTAELYRFEVKVPREAEVIFPVVEEGDYLQQLVLTNADDDTLALLVQTSSAGPAFKAALVKAVDLKSKWAATLRDVAAAEKKLKSLGEDQGRMRENLKVIPQSDAGYRKYLDEFLQIDQQIQQLRKDHEQLQATAGRQREGYEAFVMNLSVKEGEK